METVKSPLANLGLNQKLAIVFGHMSGAGRPDPDNPMPPGPWDPYIRNAFVKTLQAFGKSYNAYALNPQPLPPRVFFVSALAHEVIDLVVVTQEIEAILQGGTASSKSGSTGYLNKLVDDWCGNGWFPRFPPRPRGIGSEPEPRPDWASSELSGLDLIILGTEFEKASRMVAGKDLQQSLAQGSAKLVATGFEKLEIPMMEGHHN